MATEKLCPNEGENRSKRWDVCNAIRCSTARRRDRLWPGCGDQPYRWKAGASVIADAAYIRRSILQPASQLRAGFQAKMPSYEGKIEPAEMLEIIAYLRSIADSNGLIPAPAAKTAR